MKTDIWMPLYIGDYLRDTSRLTTEQHGAYVLLLMDYWMNGPLPSDHQTLATIARLNANSNATSITLALLVEFFEVGDDGKLHHGRVDRELALAIKNKENRTKHAKKNANKRWGNAASNAASIAMDEPAAMLQRCSSPSPSPISTKAYCSEPPGSEPAAPPIAKLPTNRKGEYYPVTSEQLDTFKRLYPAVDVPQELRNMEGWLIANPTRRKTLRGMSSFIAKWLATEQNKPRVVPRAGQVRPDAALGMSDAGKSYPQSEEDRQKWLEDFWQKRSENRPDGWLTENPPKWAVEMFGKDKVA